MKSLNSYIFPLLILMLIIGCDKDPSKPGYQSKPPKPEYYRIKMNEELKSYLWSKPGSYWIYKNTKTLENVRLNGQFVLQILSYSQYDLVRLLGKQSGNKINKIEKL